MSFKDIKGTSKDGTVAYLITYEPAIEMYTVQYWSAEQAYTKEGFLDTFEFETVEDAKSDAENSSIDKVRNNRLK